MVKGKTGNLQIFTGLPGKAGACVLPLLTLLTFIFSWLGAYPSRLVERWYARNFFPQVSQMAGRFADLVPFAWLDFTIPALLVLLVLLVKKRNWALLMNVAAAGYLIFFWSWGLNYHRPPLASKLPTVNRRTDAESMEEFTRRVASE